MKPKFFQTLKKFLSRWLAALVAAGLLLALLVLCVIGAVSAFLGLRPLDRWCASRLTDTDGQPENPIINHQS